MSAASCVVVGTGITSAVGLSSAETAASVRAGVARFSAIPMLDNRFDAFVVAEVVEDALPGLIEGLGQTLTVREERLLRLGTNALLECVAPIEGKKVLPPLFLALPEMNTRHVIEGEMFLQRFGRQVGGAFDLKRSEASFVGRAGGLKAIGRALEAIESGRTQVAIAGGIETYCDPYVLGTLDMEKRVKSNGNLDGFIPGEAAAFVLLASRAFAAKPLEGMAAVSRVSEGIEEGHLYSEEPYKGDGLAQTFATLFASGSASEPIQNVYSSMNGENHWAKEWGVSFLRSKDFFDPSHAMFHPADSYGDVGAAAGPLMVGLSAMGIRGGYRRGPCLVYCSSDFGARAALTMNKA